MAVIEGYQRKDNPKFFKQLEDEFCNLKLFVTGAQAAKSETGTPPVNSPVDLASKADMDRVMDALQCITGRLDKLETGPKAQH